ncbi:MAG: tetratricopeptide repeat protein [Vampirovibrio sp.]|nr:tetratricopeptide repeat protein [Vampirovibrio sp.]
MSSLPEHSSLPTEPASQSESSSNLPDYSASTNNTLKQGALQVSSAWETFVDNTSLETLAQSPLPEAEKNQSFSSQQVTLATEEEQLTEEQQWQAIQQDACHLLERALLLNFKGRYKEAFDLLEQAQKTIPKNQPSPMLLRVQAELIWQRYLFNPETERSQAIRRLNELNERVQSVYQRVQTAEIRSIILHYKGRILYEQGVFGQAVRLFKEALSFCQPDKLQAARIMDSLAVYYEQTGNFSQASQLYRQSVRVKQQDAPLFEQAITYQLFGRMCLIIEQLEEAQRHLERALAITSELDDYRRVASLKNDLIKISVLSNQLGKAEQLIAEAEDKHSQQKLWAQYGTTLLYKTYLLFLRQETEQAFNMVQELVLPLFEDYPQEKGFGIAYRLIGAIHNVFGRKRQALEAMGESITIFKRQGRQEELAKTYFEQAKLYVEMNRKTLAEESLLRALKIAEQKSLMFLVRPIEEELYALAPERWEVLTDRRAKHLPLFESERGLDITTSSTFKTTPLPFQLSSLDALDNTLAAEAGNNLLQGFDSKALLSLLRLGHVISSERDLDSILNIVREETVKALDAERCTVFVYDRETNELWSRVASGIDGHEILRIPANTGLAGYVLKLGEILNIPDVYADPRFNKEVDRKTGYKTRNLLCMPIKDRNGDSIGVLQVLNKQVGAFGKSDEELLMAISATASITFENAIMAQEQKRAFESFIRTLSSTIDARDPITAGHSERVSDYSLLVGEELRMVPNDLEALKYAAMLHDIGKIGIREEVLTKDGRLTIDEYLHIQEHAKFTYEILKHIHFPKHLVNVPHIAATHHEKVDGTGYFRGLKGEEIPLSGRIVALSDVFDAITSLRHYRSRMPFDKVLKIIRKDAGTHFDIECVDMFFRVPLYRLAQVLVKERRVKKVSEVSSFVRYIDKSVTLSEFEALLTKSELTKMETELNKVFSAIYYVLPTIDGDSL